jgi:hypothetical protein
MNLLMAGRVEQEAIIESVLPTVDPINDMMICPTGQFGDFLVTDRTATVLSAPEGE